MVKAKIFIPFFMVLASSANAGLLDISGVADLAAQKLKESRACGTVYYNGGVTAGAYLPIWTFHGVSNGPEYISLGAGGEGGIGGARPFGAIAFNIPAISGRIWDFQWAKDHVTRSVFPNFWLGPIMRVPQRHESFQTLLDEPKRFLGVMLSIGVSGLGG